MNSIDLQAIKRRYNIVGNCDALNHALNIALQVAATDLSVLIVARPVATLRSERVVDELSCVTTGRLVVCRVETRSVLGRTSRVTALPVERGIDVACRVTALPLLRVPTCETLRSTDDDCRTACCWAERV